MQLRNLFSADIPTLIGLGLVARINYRKMLIPPLVSIKMRNGKIVKFNPV